MLWHGVCDGFKKCGFFLGDGLTKLLARCYYTPCKYRSLKFNIREVKISLLLLLEKLKNFLLNTSCGFLLA